MDNTASRVEHIDCTLHSNPDAARRAFTVAIRRDPHTVCSHKPNLGNGWSDVVRLAYESGHEVELSQLPAPC